MSFRKPLYMPKRGVGWFLGGAPFGRKRKIFRKPVTGPGTLLSVPFDGTLAPDKAVNGSYTFLRSSAASIIDHEGRIRRPIFNEARFPGLRRVRNHDGQSNQTTSWANTGTGSHTVNQADTFQGRDCISVTYPAGEVGFAVTRADTDSSPAIVSVDVSFEEEFVWSASIGLSRALTAAESINIYYSGFGALNSFVINASNSAQFVNSFVRVSAAPKSFPGFTGAGAFGFYTFLPTALNSPCTVYIADRQFEVVSGQSNQAPSEYVENGYGADYGANVDGVKYFTTENGNSLSSGVVIEGTGAKLTGDGLLIESARTNLVQYSTVLDNAYWSKFQCNVTANTVKSPDGKINAETMTLTGTPSYPSISRTLAVSAATDYTLSCFFKAGTRNTASLEFRGSGIPGNTPDVVFSLTGAGSILLSQRGRSGIEAVGDGWYRCWVTVNTVDGSEIVIVGCGSTVAGQTLVAGETVYVYGIQLEQASFKSTFIQTTGAATVSRASEGLVYPISNVDPVEGTLSLDFLPVADSLLEYASVASRAAIGFGLSNTDVLYLSSGNFRTFDGTTTTATMPNLTDGTAVKLAVRWSAESGDMAIRQGTSQANAAFDGAYGSVLLTVGYAGANRAPGVYKNLRIYDGPVNDARFIGLTA